MAEKTITLSLSVTFDPERTDEEAVATVLDSTLGTALGLTARELLEEYGNIDVGEFVVTESKESWDVNETDITKFWKLVDEIGWGTKTVDYNNVRAGLIKKLTASQSKELTSTFNELSTTLTKAIETWEKAHGERLPVSDDGFSDLRAHIIGLGKTVYEAVLKDPELAMRRANERQYKESFSYCLPFPDDFQ